LGAVAGAHGIKGEVKVKIFTETPEGLGAYGPLTTESGRTLTIASLRGSKPGEAIVRFENVPDRNAAEGLRGEGLYVPRAALPEPEADEFYLADLIGLRAEDSAGNHFGVVSAVHNFGAGPVLEIALADGGSEFVPFADATVPIVDIAGGRIVVALPDEGV
jgi:16S rRNA processing protein RimM